MAIFKGVGVALVTPFRENGSVDYNGLQKLIDFQEPQKKNLFQH